MLLNTATLEALNVMLQTGWEAGYGMADDVSPLISMEVSSNTGQNVYAWMAQQIVIKDWIGPRQAQALGAHEYTLINKPKEATFSVLRDHILDDNLGLYRDISAKQLGMAAAKHRIKEVTSTIVANPTAFDGESMFADAHPCFDPAGSTYDNDFALALTAENVSTIRAMMSTVKGEDGDPIGNLMNAIMVGPLQLDAALEVAEVGNRVVVVQNVVGTENVAAATIGNVHSGGRYTVIENPYLTGYTWYMMNLSEVIKPFVWQVRTAPILRAFFDSNTRAVFHSNEFEFGIDGADGGSYRVASGVSLPFLAARSVPA